MHIENFPFLREFKFICENKTGAKDGCFNEKKLRSKISWQCPYKVYLETFCSNELVESTINTIEWTANNQLDVKPKKG
jgi:hypothetical protein